ncbi:lipid IV(A) 3-deoxy-D-manno-octulosonic acid transferase [Vibrio rhizosphaerae]|uniref:3-deoxy-D-manno-octulosonic acid transferase n=1 Tax=Vibrio rhizosphaerae TaxID=398736 RepID=A0ABU4IQ76_9VIBR|nr:lipid IV(A) 3-deoxy-D-manno-octulosonic acid transferase [Vibrio rhizosphaerae]MDW6091550.1 lipid IV(A) 3-deoxy-D-manno-octulosonic acid transferase [Vibrio rhizosphaerae]
MIRWIYTILLAFVAPFFLAGLYKKKPQKPAIGSRWKEHFGWVSPLQDNPEKTSPIWVHAVSVGETISVSPFIKQLRQMYPERKIVITTTTATGAEQARKLLPDIEHRYAPLDFPFAVKKFMAVIQPSHLIIMETELWPNLLHIAKAHGLNVSVINARLSEKSYRGYKRVKPLINMCLPHIDHLCCQSEEDKNRFLRLGSQASQLSVTGSMKYDIHISDTALHSARALRHILGKTRPVWIAASTHHGEDQLILQNHQTILQSHPDALLILVPRHPERFNSVYTLCCEYGLSTQRRTTEHSPEKQFQVYLGDTMGEMLTLIGASDICFMGGSLLGDVGGHNVLEPAALGIPTLIGPHYYNFHDITVTLENAGALQVIHHAQEICQSILNLFHDDKQRLHMSLQAKKVIQENAGAISKTISYVLAE